MPKRHLPVLFLTLLIDMIGIGMVIPIIPIIFTDPTSSHFLLAGYSVGMQYILAGAVTALFGLMQFVAAPILGELSDVFGRKRLLTIGVGVLALSQILFGFGIEIASISFILVSRAIGGYRRGEFQHRTGKYRRCDGAERSGEKLRTYWCGIRSRFHHRSDPRWVHCGSDRQSLISILVGWSTGYFERDVNFAFLAGDQYK
ncbi:MAG: hypothetical protein COZ29_00985 [Candidatus Moranbacteria bacterium CG_4_10_14_3_um_filter_45_9]|nr:MAG: hypothetical protein AUK19_03115 [Candidatus Moranbacteria bacterium CG2_30_45_14]PIX90245.1 MAG: hypothetical protein COZ29_00985 [Candidatus Moranbacteria bacterium CG_4_10_14_3_um_filter_45_9]PJA85066.1 MAG: hypothetical protein CO143_03195 [Candidatus Moranbacteria bacterium CG_4_9_14_3_um_filter_45_14]